MALLGRGPTPVCRRLGDYAPSPRGRHGPLLVVYGGQRAGCQLLLARHGPLVQCPALRQPHGARHACPQSHGFLPLLLSPGSCGLPSSCRPSRLMVSRRQAGVCQASPRTGRGYGPQGRRPTVEGHQGKPHLSAGRAWKTTNTIFTTSYNLHASRVTILLQGKQQNTRLRQDIMPEQLAGNVFKAKRCS